MIAPAILSLATLLIFVAGLFLGWRFGRASEGKPSAIEPSFRVDPGPADIDESSAWDDAARKELF